MKLHELQPAAGSTAAPKLMASSAPADMPPLRKITTLSTMVSPNRAVMATMFSFPRFSMPIRIQRMISPPITRHHTHFPADST